MKKVLSVLLAAVMVVSMFAGLQITSSAFDTSGQLGPNVTYTFYPSSGRIVLDGTGAMYDYTSTSHSPFYGNTAIKIVEVGSGITRIAGHLFENCTGLHSFLIGRATSLQIIAAYAFKGCSSLSRIIYPNDFNTVTYVTGIGEYAFAGCTSLEGFRMSPGMKYIRNNTFDGCTKLRVVSIPSTVTTIGSAAFNNCPALKYIFFGGSYDAWNAISIAENNETIASYKRYCYCFGDVIGDNAVYCYSKYYGDALDIYGSGPTWNYAEVDPSTPLNDFSFSTVYIGNKITSIGNYLFRNCQKMTTAVIPKGITSIGYDAFADCDSLTDVYYYGTQSQLQALANEHSGNSALTAATFHEYHLDEGACGENLKFKFDFETGIMNISGTGDMDDYNPANGGGYTMPWDNYRSQITSLVIGSGVTSIGNYAFTGTNITTLSTPSTLKRIGKNAFENCTKLKDGITINGTNCVIESEAFYGSGTSTLTAINLNGVKTVGYAAFYYVRAKTISLGNVESIANSAFESNTRVQTVSLPATCTSVGKAAFNGCSALTKLEVLNPSCKLGDSYMAPSAATIRGYKNSTAEQYAVTYGRSFETIPCASHNVVNDPAVAPTCVTPGKTAGSHCSICGLILSAQTVIPATGVHNYGELVTEPTANALGYISHICLDCGDSYVDHYVAQTGKVAGFKCAARTATAQKLTWTAMKGVTGYQAQISNAAGNAWATAKASTTNTVLFTGLTAGSGYKFRIRTFIKAPDGKNYFGPWSTTLVSPTLPAGTTVKLTAAKKAFTAQWSKKAVTGYQLQYATNAKFTGAKTITIKNAKTYKYVVKNLKAKTNYYVRVRTYKTIAKANYFSTWSATAKVKTK